MRTSGTVAKTRKSKTILSKVLNNGPSEAARPAFYSHFMHAEFRSKNPPVVTYQSIHMFFYPMLKCCKLHQDVLTSRLYFECWGCTISADAPDWLDRHMMKLESMAQGPWPGQHCNSSISGKSKLLCA